MGELYRADLVKNHLKGTEWLKTENSSVCVNILGILKFHDARVHHLNIFTASINSINNDNNNTVELGYNNHGYSEVAAIMIN